MIEFDKQPDNLDFFAKALDDELQNVNSDYEAKRYKDITLERLKLTVARKGVFYDWMKDRGKLGGQNKVPGLWNNRELIDDILKYNE